jgi:prepilin-type N-terminal cleavage/methylation domain-containing protein
MASRKVFPDRNGFTLIEMMVVIGMTIFILTLGLFLSLDAYRGYQFRSERSVLLSTLERARSLSMSNVFETTHGVCFVEPNYIIFRGATCDASDPDNETIPSSPAISITGITTANPVVFEQLTGRLVPQLSPVSNEYAITLIHGSRSEIVSINNEGRMNW